MSKRCISSAGAPAAIGPYSHAVETEGLLFVSGQLGIDPGTQALVPGGVRAETERALLNLSSILAATGLGPADVLKTTVFLRDIGDFAAMNEVYASFFPSEPPARSAFQVAALPKGGSVEIEAIARRGER
ncbi:MAG TPA: RidA family protein [Spirochaetia bacterium]|nr:RidA family protein [Spirochaetales bacterium]HRY72824.1 RidA family protein [Spirochaetia bacterium]